MATYQASGSEKATAQEQYQSGVVSDVETHTSQSYQNLRILNGGEVVEGKVDWQGRPAIKQKHGGLVASIIILAAFGFQNVSLFAVVVNLVTYLTGVMHLSTADASNAVTNFMGTSSLVSFSAAFLADAYIGRCRTLGFAVCIVLSGLILTTFQASIPSLKPPPCNIYDKTTRCEAVSGGHAALLFISLYLIAVGLAAIKAAEPAHGADQFDQKDPKEAMQLSSFFNWLLLSDCLGGAVSLIFIIWVMTTKGWEWGYGISTIAMLMCVIIFFTGMPRYRLHVIQRSNAVIEIIQVFVASFRNRKLRLPERHDELYEMDRDKESSAELEFRPHSDSLRFLDKAAIQTSKPPSPWKLCRVTQVENAKIILGIIPIFCCTIIMSTGQAQLISFSIHQGLTMDTRIIGNIKIPPASLPIIPVFFLIIIIPIYDRLFVPFVRKFTGLPTGITNLQRIGVGLLLTSAAMAIAGFVEIKRKETAEHFGMLDATPVVQPLPINILWLSFQYFVYGICDMFTNVGLNEFFYSEAPKALRSVATSLLCLSIGIGYFLSSALVTIVNEVTKYTTEGGWLEGNNLNRHHLERFYWLISILSLINFLVYLFLAHRYKYVSSISSHVNRKEGL